MTKSLTGLVLRSTDNDKLLEGTVSLSHIGNQLPADAQAPHHVTWVVLQKCGYGLLRDISQWVRHENGVLSFVPTTNPFPTGA